MKKEHNSITFIILSGVAILGIFAYVVAVNIIPDNISSNSFFSKVENDIDNSIRSMEYKNDLLKIKTDDIAKKICVKTTKSTPDDNSICWKEINNNEVDTNIYSYKLYYVWVMDNDGNISSREEFSIKVR